MTVFQRLLGAYFVSQSGSHFLTLALSGHLLATTGSLPAAAAVFVFSFLPSVLVSTHLGRWVDERGSREGYVGVELLSIGVTLLCGWLVLSGLPLGLLCAALSVRSVLGFLSRALAMKWIKEMTPSAQQAARFKLFSLTFFLATVLSGTLAAFVLGRGGIPWVVAVDCASYLLSALGIGTLPRWRAQAVASKAMSGGSAWTQLGTPLLRPLVLWVVGSQCVFQGAYSVLVSYLPLQIHGLGLGGVGWFQLAASIGIVVGFGWVWRFPDGLNGWRGVSTAAVGMACLGIAVVFPSPWGSWLGFLFMHLCYETLWLSKSAALFQRTPAAHVGRVQFLVNSLSASSMSVVTFAYALSIEQFGAVSGALLVAALVGVGFLFGGWRGGPMGRWAA